MLIHTVIQSFAFTFGLKFKSKIQHNYLLAMCTLILRDIIIIIIIIMIIIIIITKIVHLYSRHIH